MVEGGGGGWYKSARQMYDFVNSTCAMQQPTITLNLTMLKLQIWPALFWLGLPSAHCLVNSWKKTDDVCRKTQLLAIVNSLLSGYPNQILFSFRSDKDRRTDSRRRRTALCFFVWSGCHIFYLCQSWKRREFECPTACKMSIRTYGLNFVINFFQKLLPQMLLANSSCMANDIKLTKEIVRKSLPITDSFLRNSLCAFWCALKRSSFNHRSALPTVCSCQLQAVKQGFWGCSNDY